MIKVNIGIHFIIPPKGAKVKAKSEWVKQFCEN